MKKDREKKKLFSGVPVPLKLVIIVSAAVIAWITSHDSDVRIELIVLADGYALFGFAMLVSLLGEYIPRFNAWLARKFALLGKLRRQFLDNQQAKKHTTVAVYYVLRGLTVLCAILQLMEGEYFYFVLALLTLLLYTLPDIASHTLGLHLPDLLETIIYLFIFAAEILGEINNFYNLVPFWDNMLHTLNGFICAAIGFSLVDLLNRNSNKLNLSPIYVAIASFCFSMTVGVLWEFFEFTGDRIMLTDMQKDTWIHQIASVDLNPSGLNKAVVVPDIDHTIVVEKDGTTVTFNKGYLDIGLYDTMEDLFVNFIGAVIFSAFGYLYIKKRDGSASFVTNFIPTRADEKSA